MVTKSTNERRGFFAALREYFRRDKVVVTTTTDGGYPADGPRYGKTSLLFADSASTALQVATVYRCVDILSSAVASLSLRYQKRAPGGIFVDDETSRMNYLLSVQPCDFYNAVDFWAQAVRLMLLAGEAYILPIWSRTEIGEPDAFILLDRYTVNYDDVNRIYTVSDLANGVSGVFQESDIIHLKGMSLDGRHGLSVLSFARLTLGVAATGDNETLNRFANGGNIRGIVSNDTSVRGFGEYQDSELKKTAVDLDSRFQSGERIVNLPGQAKFDQISLSSVDMEFLNTRKFTVREICRFFGVPPSFVFDDTSNNYKSAEMANVAFMSQTLNPLLVRIEAELLRKLVAPHRWRKYRFVFDRRGLYAADLETLADYQTKTIASGVYTINDWRRYENKPEVEGGDRILVSANLKALDELTNPKPIQNEEKSE